MSRKDSDLWLAFVRHAAAVLLGGLLAIGAQRVGLSPEDASVLVAPLVHGAATSASTSSSNSPAPR